MAHRSIEETFQAVRPRGRTGIPNAPAIGVGVTAAGGDLSASLSEAGRQIAQLQGAYAQQLGFIAANTQALQSNTSAQANRSAAEVAGKLAGGLFGGLGILSPLISGIAGLFGGHQAPAPLPVYTPPAPIAIDATLQRASANDSALPGDAAPAPNNSNQASTSTHVTVNVNAMDSQSFMDRSADIANAVREAMLNLHPINDVVANL